MFGIDWGIDPPKKRYKGRKKGSKNKKVKAKAPPKRGLRPTGRPKGSLRPTGRPKGSRNSPESSAKIAQSQRDSKWRRHSPNKGSNNFQSSSGFSGEADYSMHSVGRVFPHRGMLDEGWN